MVITIARKARFGVRWRTTLTLTGMVLSLLISQLVVTAHAWAQVSARNAQAVYRAETRRLVTGGAIITNGTVMLGVANEGHLNVEGGSLSSGNNGTTVVGLRYVPTNGEGTAPGCVCEGWGVADAGTGATAHSDVDTGVGVNMVVNDFSATETDARSIVTAFGRLRVTHLYHPSSATRFLYVADVTIENISSADVTDLRYTRVMDWDIPPDTFNEHVTIEGVGSAASLRYADDNGFQTPNPLLGRTPILASGNQVHTGPADHGALFDFGFGRLRAGESRSFRIFYGATGDRSNALAALTAVGAEAYSLGEPSNRFGGGGPVVGTPNTFIFGFSGVGGPPIIGPSILSFSPKRGGDTGGVSLIIHGSGFVPGATVKLVREGQSPISGDAVAVSSNGFVVTASLMLSGRARGLWDLVVTNPDGKGVALRDAFTIEPGVAPQVWADIVGRTVIRPNRVESYTVLYGNRGNVDAPPQIFLVSSLEGAEFRLGTSGPFQTTPLRIFAPGAPGTSGQLSPDVTYAALTSIQTRSTSGQVTLRLEIGAVAGQPFDWDRFARDGAPTGSTPSDWRTRVLRARDRIGGSWDAVLAILTQVAADAAPPGDVLYDFDQLLRHVVTLYGSNPSEFGAAFVPGSPDVRLQADAVFDTFTVTVSSVGTPQTTPTHNFIVTHGMGGTSGGDRFHQLATQIKSTFPNANVYLVDWTPGAIKTIHIPFDGDVPNPGAVAQNINPAGEQAFAKLRDLGVDRTKATFIGESYGNYVNDIVAKEFGGVDKLLALNPANGTFYTPPNLTSVSEKAWALHTHSTYDTDNTIGDRDLWLDVPVNSSAVEAHTFGVQWLRQRLEAGDVSWLLLDRAITGVPGYDGTAHTDGTFDPSLLARLRDFLFNEIVPGAERLKDLLVGIVGSFDPNDKVGPLGSGPDRFVAADEPLRYTIFFENLETATAPAQEVVVTDTLDVGRLDLDTFSFGPISFGAKQIVPLPGLSQISTNVDLRPDTNLIVAVDATVHPATGKVTWRFTSLDPAAGAPPSDPLAGFLPPNRVPPEGSGGVSFSIKAKKPPTGSVTVIRNRATIVFDTNPAIETPEWFNTLDNAKPSSEVLALDPIQPSTRFAVRWSGTDTGSGIKDYTIFVSEDGGQFVPFVSNTTATVVMFDGQPGKRYAFYSIARDQSDNAEAAPTVPDAITQTPASVEDTTPPAVTVAASPPRLFPPTGRLVSVTVSGRITDTGSGVDGKSAAFAVIDQYGEVQPSGMIVLGADGTYSFAIELRSFVRESDIRTGRRYTISVNARDKAGNLGSASTTVTAMLIPIGARP